MTRRNSSGDLDKGGEGRRERHVDPDLDRARLGFDPCGGGFHGGGVGNVGRQHPGVAYGGAHVAGRAVKTSLAAGEQRDGIAERTERRCGGAADTATGAGDDM